jgi:hypothetical protein
MNTFRRLAVLASLLSAAACSSPITTTDEAHSPGQPSFTNNQPALDQNSTTTATDSSTSRNGGNLMGGN